MLLLLLFPPRVDERAALASTAEMDLRREGVEDAEDGE
jgi:hypothetical protein